MKLFKKKVKVEKPYGINGNPFDNAFSAYLFVMSLVCMFAAFVCFIVSSYIGGWKVFILAWVCVAVSVGLFYFARFVDQIENTCIHYYENLVEDFKEAKKKKDYFEKIQNENPKIN